MIGFRCQNKMGFDSAQPDTEIQFRIDYILSDVTSNRVTLRDVTLSGVEGLLPDFKHYISK